ncbi:acetyl/propionyl/methylcrotonyl-CoA carboxylase subunit alpha [Pseudomaricurvus alkylphenolicus]|uniref:acetyl/propionyl/methylcrotonyl-CoA carboxylase subunit alpha n=1 Tax=Pseudomaricurvus alkylphenolicus TaxID=1306991 RepID=UPI0014210526|nr:acetyl/propionyl/methylcrotonyl-CoA carboxylase subunit alpha [Pseudomaricurvus alkylphenolicus]NIB42219.1 acetyl/propionyl/methylcrotonyl-CoA carboxylase subunit alpha [Pseudomaricurvus alkylphenolicus]
MSKITKILVANRGEIAVRVMRTARDLGYRTVAVYSEADAGALHVSEADQAVCIGPAAVGESYLVADKILAAAKQTGADAIHPGYGFLSENADFSKACEAEGIVFIGPRAEAIELMGSKRLSKIAMIDAGVPCIPGYQDADQSDQTLLARAEEIGFPLMVKASAGGGGRGMRLVFEHRQLAEQIRTARSEAETAFGSGELILERAVIEPRHIEIQVFADEHGNAVYLGERDCSIQRRHQKVVEEAPSPFVDPELRQRMGEAAVNAAKACSYRGAGTVEFLVDKDKNFYFLEMNTRLQVEHPVTELITGLDLVAWQLKVASGDPLPLTQDQVQLKGHAVEVRLYAEDPRNNFMPQTGQVRLWSCPERTNSPERSGIRMDHGIQTGQQVSPFYDPMIAKVIAYGDNRAEAIRRLASAVQDTQLLGMNNNKLFLQNVLRHDVFGDGEATTAFIEQHFSSDVSMDQKQPSNTTLAKAALLYFKRSKDAGQDQKFHWSRSVAQSYAYKLEFDGQSNLINLSESDDHFVISVGEPSSEQESMALQFVSLDDNRCVYIENGVRETLHFAFDNKTLYLDDGTGHFILEDVTHQPAAAAGGAGSGQIKATMDGAIVEVLVNEGDAVEAGQTLVILEAMKMEHPLKAGISGTVSAISCEAGQQVKSKQLLVSVDGEESND